MRDVAIALVLAGGGCMVVGGWLAASLRWDSSRRCRSAESFEPRLRLVWAMLGLMIIGLSLSAVAFLLAPR